RLGEGVLVGNAGELGIGDLGALLRRGEANHFRGGGRASGSDGSIVLLNGSGQLALGLLIAIVHVSPTSEHDGHNHGNRDAGGDELGLVFHGPGNGFGGRCPERVLLKLMSSVTAHEWSLSGMPQGGKQSVCRPRNGGSNRARGTMT